MASRECCPCQCRLSLPGGPPSSPHQLPALGLLAHKNREPYPKPGDVSTSIHRAPWMLQERPRAPLTLASPPAAWTHDPFRPQELPRPLCQLDESPGFQAPVNKMFPVFCHLHGGGQKSLLSCITRESNRHCPMSLPTEEATAFIWAWVQAGGVQPIMIPVLSPVTQSQCVWHRL